MSEPTEAKTIGFTPIYCSGKAMFHVSAGVPVSDALAQTSNHTNVSARSRFKMP
nr:hypothetical protein [uncultured Pseudomonas sp.]